MVQKLNYNQPAEVLYRRLLEDLPASNALPSLYVVQHVVMNTIPFFKALAENFEISGIIAKPNSIDVTARGILEYDGRFPLSDVSRDDLQKVDKNPRDLKITQNPHGIIALDVGAYFLNCMRSKTFDGRIQGIVEDTENGHEKYEKFYKDGNTTTFPIFSVARSPLKEPEDFLVGQSIVYSVENVIREYNALLINRQVLVVGYGKIGRSIANSLAVRNIRVWVYDDNAVKRAQALSHGFAIPDRAFAIKNADLIFGATGRKSLSTADFLTMRTNTFVASVTSVDDEFNIKDIAESYKSSVEDGSQILSRENQVIYLLNQGNAVNFLHKNALGVYIYLVGCEILMCLRELIEDRPAAPYNRILELKDAQRERIAELWLEAMGPGTWKV